MNSCRAAANITTWSCAKWSLRVKTSNHNGAEPFASRFRPMHMLTQKSERSHSVNLVWADNPVDLASFGWEMKLRRAKMAHFGEFVSDCLIGRDSVEVAALDHERPRRDQRSHLGVIKSAAEVKLENLIFAHPNLAARAERGFVFTDPIVEIACANRQAIT